MNLGLPELIIVIILLATFVVPLVVAIRARPLGEHPYRWATWIAFQSALTGLLTLVSGIAVAVTGDFDEAVLSSLSGIGLLTASVGLFQRRRYGAGLAIAGQSVLLAMMMMAARANGTLPEPNQNALPTAATLAVFVLVNGIYFKKRWAALSQRRRLEPETEPMPV